MTKVDRLTEELHALKAQLAAAPDNARVRERMRLVEKALAQINSSDASDR